MAQSTEVVRVLLNTPAKSGLFDYSVPPWLSEQICQGQMVIVPFNRGVHQAIVWELNVTPEVEKLLPIQEIADPLPVMTEAQMRLAEKIAERALASLPECVNLLLTDKVRRISNPIYRLTSQNLSFQTSLVQSPAEKDALLELFTQNNGELDENTLNKAFGKGGWQNRMYSLTKSGIVQKSLRLDPGGTAPKSEATAALVPGLSDITEMNFSRIRAVNERRKAVLIYLQEHGLEVFQAELLSKTSAKREDLKALAADHPSAPGSLAFPSALHAGRPGKGSRIDPGTGFSLSDHRRGYRQSGSANPGTAARRHRFRQDRSLSARHCGSHPSGQTGADARPGNRAHTADSRPL